MAGKQKARKGLALLTKEQIFAFDDRPEAVKRLDGRAGRKPKWTLNDFEAEFHIALAVERERLESGIPRTRARTPADIFQRVAEAKGAKVRSVERFHHAHREEAREWAHDITTLFPRHRREYRELVELYGDAIGGMPATWCDRVYVVRESLLPSEIPRFDRMVKSIIGEKLKKTGERIGHQQREVAHGKQGRRRKEVAQRR